MNPKHTTKCALYAAGTGEEICSCIMLEMGEWIGRAEKAEAAAQKAHDAMLRNDERHAVEMASVRARAIKAEARVAELEKERDDLRATLGLYRYEDCPECYARAEMLSDTESLGSMTVVRPTGYRITHEESCTVGQMMPRESPSVGHDTEQEKKTCP